MIKALDQNIYYIVPKKKHVLYNNNEIYVQLFFFYKSNFHMSDLSLQLPSLLHTQMVR